VPIAKRPKALVCKTNIRRFESALALYYFFVMITIFDKDYDYESLYDLSRDIEECLDENDNKKMKKLPTDEHGYIEGTFTVTITWQE
jgi:hypothetical protein